MGLRRYAITLTGETPLLMHNDNLEWADYLGEWRKDPANKKKTKAGDDRCPAFVWLGYLYHDNGNVVIPADNLMTMLREGGKKCPTGAPKGDKSYKALSQSGLLVDQASWPVEVNGKVVSYQELRRLLDEPDFEKHEAAVRDFGFELFVKRARVSTKKHVRVRPRFDTWACRGSITVLEEAITSVVLKDILRVAGAYAGLCDWRPSSPASPGPFGKFSVEVKEL